MHRQAVPAMELPAEASRRVGQVVFAAVHMIRHADHQRIRSPFIDEAADGSPVGMLLRAGQGDQFACHARDFLADGNADFLLAVVESEQGALQIGSHFMRDLRPRRAD